jgi:probable rRNA maturation factor
LSAAIIQRAAVLFLLRRGIRSAELSLVFVTGRSIRKINREHLGHDYVTDIVTFDLRIKGLIPFDGELVICPAEALRNARAFGQPIEQEVLRYVAHGILHLLGYDDATAKQRAVMRKEENKLLALIWP